MSYFGGSSRIAGDPGFFGSLGGFFKKALPVAAGLGLGGPLGAGIALASKIRRPSAPTGTTFARPRIAPVTRVPGITGAAQRLFPGGATGFQVDANGMVRPRRRRMNPTNAKALRRAIRRTDAFVNVAKGALRNTGFKIVSKSAGKMTEAAWQKKAHHAK